MRAGDSMQRRPGGVLSQSLNAAVSGLVCKGLQRRKRIERLIVEILFTRSLAEGLKGKSIPGKINLLVSMTEAEIIGDHPLSTAGKIEPLLKPDPTTETAGLSVDRKARTEEMG
jgi:hypothetical protein